MMVDSGRKLVATMSAIAATLLTVQNDDNKPFSKGSSSHRIGGRKEVTRKSALALSRDLGVSYKTAFVLPHKLRDAMPVAYSSVPLAVSFRTD